MNKLRGRTLILTIILITIAFLHAVPSLRHGITAFFFPHLDRLNHLPDPALTSMSKAQLIEKIKQQQAELEKLRGLRRVLNYAMRDNLQLRRSLNMAPIPGYRYIHANIIFLDPAQGGRVVRLDRGAKDGIKAGAGVIADGYFVGRIFQVDPHSSICLTIGDPRCKVPARIRGIPAFGILEGTGEERWKSIAFCLLRYLPTDLQYTPGMRVETSPYGLDLPPGIPIGILQARDREKGHGIIINHDNLYLSAWVKPARNLYNRSWVTIVVPEENTPAND
ncbi:MAG: rod shape-determining protein MreC [Lentisphaerae bacterium]|nr:MAG: rod shape-determining protein MreC [Lentisphaerota bacterium]